MSADQDLDGMPIDPMCPIHGGVMVDVGVSALGVAASALTDQQMSAERDRYDHAGQIHANYFQALAGRGLPLELAAVMTREMANVYWNLELRK